MTAVWKATETGAELSFGKLSGCIWADVHKCGFKHVMFSGESCGAISILGVGIATEDGFAGTDGLAGLGVVSDRFIRGNDFVVTYEATKEPACRVQVYWRAVEETGALAALELQVSVQTPLLEMRPELATQSFLDKGTAWRLRSQQDHSAAELLPLADDETFTSSDGPGVVVWRTPNGKFSQVEMLPPSDFEATRLLCTPPGPSLSHKLFGGSLEKGVILRSRVRWALVPRENDAEAAAALYDDFVASPLPLTT
jgi:hypothetical protein